MPGAALRPEAAGGDGRRRCPGSAPSAAAPCRHADRLPEPQAAGLAGPGPARPVSARAQPDAGCVCHRSGRQCHGRLDVYVRWPARARHPEPGGGGPRHRFAQRLGAALSHRARRHAAGGRCRPEKRIGPQCAAAPSRRAIRRAGRQRGAGPRRAQPGTRRRTGGAPDRHARPSRPVAIRSAEAAAHRAGRRAPGGRGMRATS